MNRIIFLAVFLVFFVEADAQKPYAAVDHISLHVQKLERSATFYADLFQFDSIPDPFPDFRVTWFIIGEGVQLHLFEESKPIPQGKYHLCFRVRNLDEFIDRLKSRNISYFDGRGNIGAFTTRSDNVRQLYFKDPDGHKIEVNDAAR